jgi:hypothetical protein
MKTPKQLLASISPERRRKVTYGVAIGALVFGAVLTRMIISSADLGAIKPKVTSSPMAVALKVTPTRTPSLTPIPPSPTLAIPAATDTPLSPTNTAQTPETPTATETPIATHTPTPVAATATPTAAALYTPWPGAPLCLDVGEFHDNSRFHTLWDDVRGCHYDHEHGQDPFTPEVAVVFPGIQDFLGGVQIGHTNPSSPLENTAKHGGFKWHVQLTLPQPCVPFEAATTGASAAVVQYHSFGDEGIELEARTHSAVIFVRQCKADNPSDVGYVYATTLQDYGQRIVPYQGTVVGYPNQPVPAYNSSPGPYLSTDCVDPEPTPVPQCRPSLAYVLGHNPPLGVNSRWTSKHTYGGAVVGTPIFQLLFRLRDGYRLFDWRDQEWPFTFLWLCTSDGGATYDPVGCRYNNSTTQVQEIQGTIPAEWDNLVGFDTNSTVGRVTGNGYTTSAGALTLSCSVPGMNCYPIHLVNAFVGQWGAVLVYTTGKDANIVSVTPERDIFFCGGNMCAEDDPGAVPSGWIGPNN